MNTNQTNRKPISPARRFIIRGRVQGVGFRYATQCVAERMALSGWVRNLPNGDVEAVAGGDTAQLDAFESWLHHGPDYALVGSVHTQEMPVADSDSPRTGDGFCIRRG